MLSKQLEEMVRDEKAYETARRNALRRLERRSPSFGITAREC
jgi:hypothetical protein